MSILSTDEQPKRMSKKIETTYFTQRERSGKIKKKEQRRQGNGRIYQMAGRHKTTEQDQIHGTGDRADRILLDTVKGRRLGRPRSMSRISSGLSEGIPAL